MFEFLKDLFDPKPEPKPEPVTIKNEFGKFSIDSFLDDYTFSGETNVPCISGKGNMHAEVECDDKETLTATKGFERLSEVLKNLPEWDERLKKIALDFAVETYLLDDGTLEIWGNADPGDEDYFIDWTTQEDFLKRISINNVHVYSDGKLEFFIDLDGMYTDHGLEVDIDKEGNVVYCDLV